MEAEIQAAIKNMLPWLVGTAAVLTLMLLTKPTRGLLKGILKPTSGLIKWLYALLAGMGHKVGITIWRAHLIYLRNALPRNIVLPSVAVKTTRRQR